MAARHFCRIPGSLNTWQWINKTDTHTHTHIHGTTAIRNKRSCLNKVWGTDCGKAVWVTKWQMEESKMDSFHFSSTVSMEDYTLMALDSSQIAKQVS